MARATTWVLIGAVAVAAAVVVLTVVDDDSSAPGDSAGPELGITLRELTARPADFHGRVVVVSGDVRALAPDDVEPGGDRGGVRIPASAFSIGGRARERQVLVVGPAGESQLRRLEPGELVRVRGVVREFGGGAVAAALEQPERLAGRWFAQWEGRPAIIAELIDVTPPVEVDEAPPSPGE